MDDLIKSKIKTMEDIFREDRKIVPNLLEEVSGECGDVFKTENGEIVYLEVQINDFTIDELVRYTKIAEHLYSKYGTHCTCYVLCIGEVLVNEMSITSEADFTIKLSQSSNGSACDFILQEITRKIDNNILLDKDDIQALQYIPLMSESGKRDYYRKQVFTILNELGL